MKKQLSELRNWDKNPRSVKKDDFARLKRLILKLGIFKPFVITEDGTVLGGNMRLRAVNELVKEGKLKITDVPVVVVKADTEEKKIEYALADNDRVGSYEDQALAELLQDTDIDLGDYKVDLGQPVSLDKLLEQFGPDIEEDEAPEIEDGEPDSKLGEVYQLGRHRLMCGDATKIEDVDKLMDGKKADMVFTDPPYNVDYKGVAGSIKNDKFKNNQAFYQFLYDSFAALRPFVFGDVYCCMSSSELHTLQKAFIDCGGHWSTFLIWVKDRFTLGRSNYQRQYEPILYGWFDGSSHYWSGARNLGDVVKLDEGNVDELGNVWLLAENLSVDVWDFPKPDKNKEHPTMKPIRLCARGILNSSKRDGLVLDTFGGSGSTLIACEQTNRTCYMSELDPKYVDVIRKRYWKFVNDTEDGWQEGTKAM